MPLTIWLLVATLLDITISLTDDGFYLDPLNDIAPVNRPETLECPSNNVITTTYKCNVNGEWVACTRKHCCPNYIFIANKCIPKDQDPCEMNLCEQKCTVYLQRVICTCFDGYKFSPENQKNKVTPVCIDVNECDDKNGDCQHKCINEIGSYRCECDVGFKMHPDNRSCIPLPSVTDDGAEMMAAAIREDHCYANCDTVLRLHEKLKHLQDKILALSTAVRMSSFASGPPGPAGPPGPPGPRGFPGPEGTNTIPSVTTDGEDYTYSMLDTFIPLPNNAGQSSNNFCKCKRGSVGPPGATGKDGQKGESGEKGQRGPKGDKGSLDFVLLLLADLRHDIMHLQNKVYTNGEKPPVFNLNSAMKTQRVAKEKEKQKKLLHGYSVPVIEMTPSSVHNAGGQQTSNAMGFKIAVAAAISSHDTQSIKTKPNQPDPPFILSEYVDYEGSSYMDDSYENYSN